MIYLDTRWKPGPGRATSYWVAGAPTEGHVFARDDQITFPPSNHRSDYALAPSDAWAALVGLSDYGAFQSFGPAGSGDGTSEPAKVWQDTIELLTERAIPALTAAVTQEMGEGNIYAGMNDAGSPALRARTVRAYVLATCLTDMIAGRSLRTCETCRRQFVPSRAKQVYCSTRCRMKAHREES